MDRVHIPYSDKIVAGAYYVSSDGDLWHRCPQCKTASAMVNHSVTPLFSGASNRNRRPAMKWWLITIAAAMLVTQSLNIKWQRLARERIERLEAAVRELNPGLNI